MPKGVINWMKFIKNKIIVPVKNHDKEAVVIVV
jgi:hypothetical protein